MRRDDALWKSILENVFEDFLRFFFKDAEKVFDLEKGFEYLDKELEPLCPMIDGSSPKFVDKLVKVYTRAGREKWLLLHIEVQGYKEANFPKRMFTYFYRILDRYEKPVTAIAILTDGNLKFRPSIYRYRCKGVSLRYQYQVYKIADQREDELLKNENPFAVVILTALMAIRKKKVEEPELYDLKIGLAKNLLRRKIPASKITSLMSFIKHYLHFDDQENNNKFEEEIALLTNKNETMGIEEFLLDRAKKQGIQEGIAQGVEEGIAQGIEKGIMKGFTEAQTIFVTNLLRNTDFPVDKIADLANVPESFVDRVKNTLN
jgi:hypothetical protein